MMFLMISKEVIRNFFVCGKVKKQKLINNSIHIYNVI